MEIVTKENMENFIAICTSEGVNWEKFFDNWLKSEEHINKVMTNEEQLREELKYFKECEEIEINKSLIG